MARAIQRAFPYVFFYFDVWDVVFAKKTKAPSPPVASVYSLVVCRDVALDECCCAAVRIRRYFYQRSKWQRKRRRESEGTCGQKATCMGYLPLKYNEGIVNLFVWMCVPSCLPVILAPSIFSLSMRAKMAFASCFVFISMRKKGGKCLALGRTWEFSKKQNASLSSLFFAHMLWARCNKTINNKHRWSCSHLSFVCTGRGWASYSSLFHLYRHINRPSSRQTGRWKAEQNDRGSC